MIYLKYVLSIILLSGSVYSQINISLQKVIILPENLVNNEFHPTNLSVNRTGFYFLDSFNRQVAFLSNDGQIEFAGGYGLGNDAFIDPIEILSSNLRVWIVDRTENKLIEFDHKLNFLRIIEFDQFYPKFSGIDDWGNILLLSEQEHMIFKANPPFENFIEFIDLSNNINECISGFHVSSDGTAGILSNGNNSIYLFNRLGKLENIFHLEDNDSKYLIKLSDSWFVISFKGHITSIRHNEKVALPKEQNIVDVTQMDSKLYLLFSDQIWVVDVSME